VQHVGLAVSGAQAGHREQGFADRLRGHAAS
jgi:hypothetical protein